MVNPALTTTDPTATLQSGTNVTVTWTDTNQGNRAVNGTFFDYVLVQKVKSDGGLTTLATANVLGNSGLTAGASSPQQYAFRLPDGGDGAGTIQVTVTTDNYNNIFEYNTLGLNGASTAESNNTASATVTSALAPYPDLQVANLAINPASGTQIQSGGNLVVSWDDNNTGTGGVSGPFSDYVLVQRINGDGSLSTLSSGTLAGANSLAAGSLGHQQYNFRLPDGTPGTGSIVVTVTTDVNNSIFEYNTAGPSGSSTAESNNTAIATVTSTLAAYPDFQVSNVQVPSIGSPASPIALTYTITNAGNADAVGTWTDSVYLSADPSGSNPRFLQSFSYTEPLTAGQAVDRTQTVNLPGDIQAGDLYILVTANSGNDIFESDTTNNTGVSAVILIPPSLTVTITNKEVAETASPVRAVVTRSGDVSQPLIVNLSALDGSGNSSTHASVPATVTIPAGLVSQDFLITPIHDGLATGRQTVLIEAQADPSTGIALGIDMIKIDDVDKASVKLTIAATQLDEGQSAQATVTIDPVEAFDVTVSLVASLPFQLDMPQFVVIPKATNAFTFTIAAIDDGLYRAFQSVSVIASAAGFGQDTQSIGVSDNDVPPVVVTVSPGSIMTPTSVRPWGR